MNASQAMVMGLAAALALGPGAAAGTWYVNGTSGSDANSCTSALSACKTIGHAVGLASAGDTVKVAKAVYPENLTISISLNVAGAGAPGTIIDGQGVARVISILNSSATVTISGVTIYNGAAAGGGGILNWGTLRLDRVAITKNSAVSSYSAVGSGIYNSGTLAINSSTLSGNGALGFNGGGGGGVYNDGTAVISSSTLSGNTGTPNGGGIYNDTGTVTLQNTIVTGSVKGGNCYGLAASAGYNLSSDLTCNFAGAGDLNNVNPMLGALAYNGGPTPTLALLNGSPAIDAGNPAGCTDGAGVLLKTDQRGMPRPDKEDTGGCDMGAFEKEKAK